MWSFCNETSENPTIGTAAKSEHNFRYFELNFGHVTKRPNAAQKNNISLSTQDNLVISQYELEILEMEHTKMCQIT